MKIALVHNTYLEQGGEDVVFWQERALLKEAGHEVLEYQRFNSEMDKYSPARRLTLIGRTVWAPDSYRDFTTLLRDGKPDIVHVHNTFPLISPSIFWACRDARIPVVQTLHNYRLLCPGANFIRDGKPCEDCTKGSIWQSVAHGCYRDSRTQTAAVALMLTVHRARKTWTDMVDHYVVLTDFARGRFVSAGLPVEKITVKPNCVDPDPGMRKGEGSYALFVGRVSEEKGALTLLKAWAQLPTTLPLRVIGGGPAMADLQAEARAQGLSNVTFMGRLPRKQVMEGMKEARFLIFPSQLYENLPLTIIEAFACGVPVIASRLGAMQEVVEEDRTGLLFQAGDSNDLARAVALAWKRPDYMLELGKQARAEYEAKYTAAANYTHLMKIYEQVIADRIPDTGRIRVKGLQEVSSL
jgi:glycosyltransferase involved in cell wall biosynthesis